jgi:hypothetical protein
MRYDTVLKIYILLCNQADKESTVSIMRTLPWELLYSSVLA